MTLPSTMNAIEIREPGGPEVLQMVQRPLPAHRAKEVLIRVGAAGINRPDVFQRRGFYPPPPGASDIPGLEVSGTIVAVGTKVERWKVGDQVCALVAGGGYAEFCAAPAGQCLPIPTGLAPNDAAALPETFFTVWTNVFDRGRLREGESFLVHGGSSGIGTAAIQIAKAFGARVFTTAGSSEKLAACLELGADRAINYHREDFAAVIEEETGGLGVDLVLDMVGGDYVHKNLACLAVEGRHVSIAFLRGAAVELDLSVVMRKRLTLTGSTLRARPIADKTAIAEALEQKVWPLLEAGTVRPVIDRRFSLGQAGQAQAYLETGAHIGKLLLSVE